MNCCTCNCHHMPSPELKALSDTELLYMARLMVHLNPADVEHFKKIRPDDWKVIEHLVVDKSNDSKGESYVGP